MEMMEIVSLLTLKIRERYLFVSLSFTQSICPSVIYFSSCSSLYCLSANVSFHLSLYQSVCRYFHPSVCLSNHLSVYFSVYACHPSICLSSVRASLHPFIRLSIRLCIHICLSICLFYISAFLSINMFRKILTVLQMAKLYQSSVVTHFDYRSILLSNCEKFLKI